MSGGDGLRIAVIGAGAVGGWVAARLALAGHRVMALTSGGSLKRLDIEEGGASSSARFAEFAGPADLVILSVKAPSLAAAIAAADRAIGPSTIIVPMLNGVPWWFTDEPLRSVDPDGRIAASIPRPQLVGSVVHAACSRSGSRILVKHVDRLILGEPEGADSERVATLCATFESAGIGTEASGNVRQAIWYKLWGNATINPLSALTRATCDRILADPECRAWMLEGMAELAAVGAAIGCAISESGEDRLAVTARLGAFKTSMLQDVEAHRPIELEALLGAPRELARRHGIETPALDRLYGLTRLLSDSLAR
jgi:2-dehydropantoate 2-reductase